MAHTKALILIGDFIASSFIGINVLGIVSFVDNTKSVLLFILGTIYFGLRVYYYRSEKEQQRREKELELWRMERENRKLDEQDKITQHNN